MVGEIVHIELPSRDFGRSANFYAKLFGWKTDGVQSGGHLLFDSPGGVQGSWIRDALAQAPGPVPFVAVDDVDKTLADAEKQGGRILVQRMTLPNGGVCGLLADCDGNVVGVIAHKGMTRSAAAPEGGQAAKSGESKSGESKSGESKSGETKSKDVAKPAAKKPSARKR